MPPSASISAKSVSQIHAVRKEGTVALRRKLRRGQVLAFLAACPSCLVGIEACAGAHCWAHQPIALSHDVWIIPAGYVKPYVKRGTTDAADAEAIRDAVTRPTRRFVPVKSAARQGALIDRKTRGFLVRRQTRPVNAIRAHLAEFGLVCARGIHTADRLLALIEEAPATVRRAPHILVKQLRESRDRNEELAAPISAAQKEDPLAPAVGNDPRDRPL